MLTNQFLKYLNLKKLQLADIYITKTILMNNKNYNYNLGINYYLVFDRKTLYFQNNKFLHNTLNT